MPTRNGSALVHCSVTCKDNKAVFFRSKMPQDTPLESAMIAPANWLHTAGVEFMNKLVEIRTQEMICRERARLNPEHKVFWSAQAEQWEQRALDEIAYHFRECNAVSVAAAPTVSSPAASI